jgi:hypothetical protein
LVVAIIAAACLTPRLVAIGWPMVLVAWFGREESRCDERERVVRWSQAAAVVVFIDDVAEDRVTSHASAVSDGRDRARLVVVACGRVLVE